MRTPRTLGLRSGVKLFATLLSGAALSLANNSYADELDLRLSNDSVHGNFTLNNARSKATFGLGYFYKDDDVSINVINVDLHAKGQTVLGNLPATIGVGFQGNFFKAEDFKGSAVGLGGTFKLNIPSAPGLSIESDLHYAPSVLSFGDADEFRRFRVQSNYRIIENADISIGYRYLNVGVEQTNQNENFESGAFIGLQLSL